MQRSYQSDFILTLYFKRSRQSKVSMNKFFAALVSNCNKSWQYPGIGHLATSSIISLLLSLNLFSIVLLVVSSSLAIRLKSEFLLYSLVTFSILFILINLFFPWKRIRKVEVTKKDENKYGWIFLAYGLTSCALMILSLEITRLSQSK